MRLDLPIGWAAREKLGRLVCKNLCGAAEGTHTQAKVSAYPVLLEAEVRGGCFYERAASKSQLPAVALFKVHTSTADNSFVQLHSLHNSRKLLITAGQAACIQAAVLNDVLKQKESPHSEEARDRLRWPDCIHSLIAVTMNIVVLASHAAG